MRHSEAPSLTTIPLISPPLTPPPFFKPHPSQVSDPSAIQRAPARVMRDPVSTLPKPRPLLGEMHDYGQSKTRLRTSVVGLVRPASAHGAGGGGVGGGGGCERGGVSSLSSSPHHCALNMGFPLTAAEVKVRVLLLLDGNVFRLFTCFDLLRSCWVQF